MRRDLPLAAALVIVLVAVTPAYTRVLPETTWRGPVLVAALLAVALAAAVRALRLGAGAAAVVSLIGLVATLHVTVLPDVGLLPDASSFDAYRELLAQAAVDLREQRPPAPTTPGFVTALVTAAWLVAHASHEVLVRLRSPGLALVPPLVLWALPLAIPFEGTAGAVGRAVPLLLAAGLVLLLAADPDPDAPARVPPSGVVLGGLALLGAVLAPSVLPAYGAAALLDLDGGADPRGYQPIVDISERLQQPIERDVLVVRADQRSYLRLAGLDSFDGAVWRLGPAGTTSYQPPDDALHPGDRPLPPEVATSRTTPVRAEIEVLDLANIYVPAPYQPVAVSGPLSGQMIWSTEGGFLATWSVTGGGPGQPRVGVTRGASYRVDAERPTPDIEQLREVTYDAATLERWTQLPGPTGGLGDIARDVYREAGATTAVDAALALQDWFTGDDRFTYSLEVPPLRGADELVDFVTTSRVGYCEQFATAMAVMLRETGIPARVAVGFLPGEVTLAADPDAGRDLTEYTVSTTDAHAWVEVLFPGHGWVAFEPTPRDDRAQSVPRADDLTPQESEAERDARLEDEAEQEATEPEVDDADEAEVDAGEDGTDEEPAGPDDAVAGGAGTEGRGFGGVLPVLLLALLGLGALLATSRARPAPALADGPTGRAVGAQRRLLAGAAALGVPRDPHETLTETLARWVAEGRTSPTASERLAELAPSAAFGGEVSDETAAEVERLTATLLGQLRDAATPTERLLVPVRPRWDQLRERAADLRGWRPTWRPSWPAR